MPATALLAITASIRSIPLSRSNTRRSPVSASTGVIRLARPIVMVLTALLSTTSRRICLSRPPVRCDVMTVPELLNLIAARGGIVHLEGSRIRYDLAGDAAALVPDLIARCEIRRFLQDRAAVPPLPRKLRLLSWKLKLPPVMVETVSVVSDPADFAANTLKQLAVAVADPAWNSIIPHLLDRLAQVGVVVALRSDR
jgi:hypothetical protein